MVIFRERFAREHILRHGDSVPAVYVRVNGVIHHHRGRLVAPAETGNITDGNFLHVGTLKGSVKGRPDLVASAQVTAHVGAHAHVDFWRRAEMKVGIEAGYRMDLTDRDVYLSRERLELIGGQVAEISLYGPQFFKHDARDSAAA
jgi:hypothetical protein